jgi:hypothetical protein
MGCCLWTWWGDMNLWTKQIACVFCFAKCKMFMYHQSIYDSKLYLCFKFVSCFFLCLTEDQTNLTIAGDFCLHGKGTNIMNILHKCLHNSYMCLSRWSMHFCNVKQNYNSSVSNIHTTCYNLFGIDVPSWCFQQFHWKMPKRVLLYI